MDRNNRTISAVGPATYLKSDEVPGVRWRVATRRLLGSLVALNFAIVWVIPVIVQGQSFRRGLAPPLRVVYGFINRSPVLRRVAERVVYRQDVHADYFAAAILLLITMIILLSTLFAWQIAFGSLPWWLVAIYYFAWIGPGGRCVATAWTFAHREGHHSGGRLYQPWLGERIGNPFENWLGVFYGIVPYTFSTTHILTHHRFDNGKGDPIYCWDIDRTCFSDLMLYQWRFILYMTGIASLREFRRETGVHPVVDEARTKLRRGMAIYWVWVPTGMFAILIATGSSVTSGLLFLFLIYLQPFLGMTTFLSIINIGQHGFLEFDDSGRHVKHVTSTTIIDGPDNYFGEDYHVAHHYDRRVDHRGVSAHVARERSAWASCHGTVFENTTFFEITLMIARGQFDQLIRDHYVDFNGERTVAELAQEFERRAKRIEMPYEHYEFQYLPSLRKRVREWVKRGVFKSENEAYVYQSHHNVQ